MKNLSLSTQLGTALLSSVMFMIAGTGAAYADNTITIESATVAANQLTLTGDFAVNGTIGNSPVSVRFGSKDLPIVSKSDTQIVATLLPLPPMGTYRAVVTVGNKSDSSAVTISPTNLTGGVNADGSYPPGTTVYTATRISAGHYHVTFPVGTFQVGNPGVFPALMVKAVFGTTPANVYYYLIRLDQSGEFFVDFGGIDTAFYFTVSQTF